MATHTLDRAPVFLAGLGWSAFFADQVAAGDEGLVPCRIAVVHRTSLSAKTETDVVRLTLPPHTKAGEFAVGDWVLVDAATLLVHRRLNRRTLLQRTTAGGIVQLGAANVDTMFIVTSCNADFNVARLERYLTLANGSGVVPVIVLTKPDTADQPEAYERQSRELQRDVAVVTVNARTPAAAEALAQWCRAGETVALVGSSGVGKSTLVNTLVGTGRHLPQETGGIREHDGKGRHTTTSRSLHPIAAGGWIIDTPGIRAIQITDMAEGIDVLFAEITELAPRCKFRNCTHQHEPGCAVRAAVARGEITPERLDRWLKLQAENSASTPSGRARPGSHPRS